MQGGASLVSLEPCDFCRVKKRKSLIEGASHFAVAAKRSIGEQFEQPRGGNQRSAVGQQFGGELDLAAKEPHIGQRHGRGAVQAVNMARIA